MSVAIRTASSLLALGALVVAPAARAITFDIGDDISGTLNTFMTLGAGVRMQDRAVDLVGKGNLNPDVCGGIAQSCQGVFRNQIVPAQTNARASGAAFLNGDDGNWNYDRGDLTQAVFKATQDLNLSWGNYGFFAKWLYFYDFVNNDFTEFHPNWVSLANQDRVGCTDALGTNGCRNVTGYDRSYGPGEPTYLPRSDGETLRQIGTDLQMFDYYFFGQVDLPFLGDRSLTWKLGSQNLNWGESTALVINSLNQVNAVNVNNLFRTGFDLSELFVPQGMLFMSMEPFESATIEAFYSYEWKPVEIPAPGSFFSFADLGTNNALNYVNISFGTPAESGDFCPTGAPPAGTDAEFDYYNPGSACQSPANNPLSGLTGTSLTIRRLEDNEPSDQGQWGFAFKYFAEWLNNGTELGFYFMNYHSKLPYVSVYSTVASCARSEGNSLGRDATTGGPDPLTGLLGLCNDIDTPAPTDLPVVQPTYQGARGATRNAVPIDTVRYQVEYPENIQMYGVSFNTTLGDISLQGEAVYRPNMPLQVDLQDLTFHALGPMLARCHDPLNSTGECEGTTTGVSQVDTNDYGTSDFNPYPDWASRFPALAAFAATSACAIKNNNGGGYCDTFDLGVGAGVGSARSFPSFVGAYRGIPAGETPPNSYIRGWEEFDVFQFNLGGTYVQGATDNVIGADQLIWLFEVGAQWVPDLPGTDMLQIESPGTDYHASAGGDGSMTGNYAQDCAHTPDCHYGGYNVETGQFYGDCTAAMLADQSTNAGCGDGLRFNPHQQDPDLYADKFSAGYVIVSLIRYESVFPGVSFAPLTLFQHDVYGTSTDVAAQFTESRKDIVVAFEIRYKESVSIVPGYMWFTGGGSANLQRDRDQAFGYVKYLF
jgi:hypothetical protein